MRDTEAINFWDGASLISGSVVEETKTDNVREQESSAKVGHDLICVLLLSFIFRDASDDPNRTVCSIACVGSVVIEQHLA